MYDTDAMRDLAAVRVAACETVAFLWALHQAIPRLRGRKRDRVLADILTVHDVLASLPGTRSREYPGYREHKKKEPGIAGDGHAPAALTNALLLGVSLRHRVLDPFAGRMEPEDLAELLQHMIGARNAARRAVRFAMHLVPSSDR